MTKLAELKYKHVIRFLKANEFTQKKQKATSHEQWINPNFKGGYRKVTVDKNDSPFEEFIIKSMASQAGYSDWKAFWKECLDA